MPAPHNTNNSGGNPAPPALSEDRPMLTCMPGIFFLSLTSGPGIRSPCAPRSEKHYRYSQILLPASGSAKRISCLVESPLRHGDARITCRKQRHHLCAAHRRICIRRFGRISPGAKRILRLRTDDQFHSLFERGSKPHVIRPHPVSFRQGERGEAMIVHGTADVACLLVRLFENEIQTAFDGQTVRTELDRRHARAYR